MILACKNIHKSFITDVVLDDITFHIEEKEKIALIGMNGSGKTTLFRIICNEIAPDKGEVIKSKNCSIGYLPQHVSITSDLTVYEELRTVFHHIIKMEKELHNLEILISKSSPKDLDILIKEYDLMRHTFEENQGYSYESLIRGVLKGLGLASDVYDQPISILSGGQKTRVALAKLLLQNPNVLLLDEPTNHLDIAAIEWLENFLKGYNGAVILISHDRYFLDSIVTKVVEIEHHKSRVYEGNYSYFVTQKKINHDIEMRHYTNQQQEIKRQEQVIDKLRQFNREKSIKRAMSREKQLSKVERLDKPLEQSSGMKLTLKPQIQSGNDVIRAKDISKSFDDSTILFKNISFEIKRGDRIALLGPNGVGKTTLFRIIMDIIKPSEGIITRGTNVVVGYYDQEHQNLNESATIIEEIQNSFPSLNNSQIRNVLAAFLFTGDDVFKPISTLSGGEKGRVALSKIMLSEANLLLLDEPTNHLDIQSKEILEEAITNYEGTVLYISHDRYFINKTATKVFELLPTGVDTYLGNYDYYIEKRLQASSETMDAITTSTTKDDWLKSKELEAQKRRLEKEILEIESKISDIENSISFIEQQLCLEDVYTNPEKSASYVDQKTTLEYQLEDLYAQWEKYSLANT